MTFEVIYISLIQFSKSLADKFYEKDLKTLSKQQEPLSMRDEPVKYILGEKYYVYIYKFITNVYIEVLNITDKGIACECLRVTSLRFKQFILINF